MIRKFCEKDMKAAIDIWLSASIKSHNFIDASFWESNVENMRTIYIPSAETYVFEKNSKVMGFYCLNKNNISALFVSPEFQRMGIGSQLIEHAKNQRNNFTLSVYALNKTALKFYKKMNFHIISKGIDDNTGHEEYLMSNRI